MSEPTVPGLEMDLLATLAHAMRRKARVHVTLRDDSMHGHAARTIDGVPIGFRPTKDGRQRVIIAIADGAEQTVLFEKIAVVTAH